MPLDPAARKEVLDSTTVEGLLLSGGVEVARRIMFPTIPSSGSTWIRQLVDMSRGIASESVYGTNEGGMWHAGTLSYGHAWHTHCGPNGPGTRIRGAVSPEAVLVKTHWPFANFISLADERFARPSTVGGVIKTVRDPRSTYSDCARKKYAGVHNQTFEVFLQRYRRHHAFWDALAARNIAVVDIPFESLQSKPNVTAVLFMLGSTFFPEITPERARRAVSLYPPRGVASGTQLLALPPTPPPRSARRDRRRRPGRGRSARRRPPHRTSEDEVG